MADGPLLASSPDACRTGRKPDIPMKQHLIRRTTLSALLLLALTCTNRISGQDYEWSTFAGNNGGVGFVDGPSGVASFKSPVAVAIDATGDIYLADTGNHTIRKISPAGMVSTLAGKGGISGNLDGSGDQARFNRPGGLVLDDDGSIFVADTGNHTIRKISRAGMVTTLAGESGVSGHSDGMGRAAHFSSPVSIALAPNRELFVADSANHVIRRISAAGWVTTFAGQAGMSGSADGGPEVARFNAPRALAIDEDGTLYIADSDNCLIRRISSHGEVTTLAGQALAFDYVDGIGTEARFSSPEGIVVDSAHNLYVADAPSGTIRRIAASDRMVTTLAGNIDATEPGRIDGTGTAALFNEPRGLAFASDGSLLVADTTNHALRKVTTGGEVTTIAVNPPRESGAVDAVGTAARFRSPYGLTVDGEGNLFIADTGNRTIRRISPGGEVTTVAGAAGLTGTADGTGAAARFMSPRAVAFGPGGVAYVADVVSTRDSTIRKITPTGAVSTLAGTPGTLAYVDSLYFLTGLAVDASGNVFATDRTSVRKITPLGIASVFAGQKRLLVPGMDLLFWSVGTSDGTGTAASFTDPSGLAIDGNRNLYVTESGGCVVRKVTSAGQVTTLAGAISGIKGVPGASDGNGSAARFRSPHGVAVDARGTLYIADSGNHTIRKISPAGVVTTIGGLNGYAGSGEGAGDRALFNQPFGIAVDSSGTLYVADTVNQRIVRGVAPLASNIVVADSAGNHFSSGGPALEFGNVAPSTAGRAQILAVFNTGDTPLDITDVAVIGDNAATFACDRAELPASIPPDGTGVIRVTFNPDGLGLRNAILRISNNDPDESTFDIALRGTGNSLPVFSGYAISSPPVAPVRISLKKLLASAFDPDGDAMKVTSVGWPTNSLGSLVLSSDSIDFTPSYSNFEGKRTFLATITDARGGSVTGNITVTWQTTTASGAGSMTSNPPQLTLQPDGTAKVAFHGIPGRTYQVQRSPTLATWEHVADVIADPSGDVVFIDPNPPKPSAYYRLAAPQ